MGDPWIGSIPEGTCLAIYSAWDFVNSNCSDALNFGYNLFIEELPGSSILWDNQGTYIIVVVKMSRCTG